MFFKYSIFLWRIHLCVSLQQDKPNVVIFLVDDFGWGDFGANYKNGTSNTPRMDAFAKDGIRFTDFHVASSVCTPSRSALLTGRLGLRTGVNMLFGPWSVGGLPLTELTITDVLKKQQGYNTFAIGKWHLGHNGLYHPIERGFDHYFGVPYSLDNGCLDNSGYIHPSRKSCKTQNSSYFVGLPLYKDKKIIQQPLDIRNLSNLYLEEFKERIAEQKERNGAPFFAYIPFSHLHVPLGYDKKYLNASNTIFQNTLRELDSTFGEMINVLKENDLYENSLIWLLGDNGPWESQCQYAGSPGPYQGLWQKNEGGGGASWKSTVWEGGHRVPAAVSWLKRIPQNVVSDALVSSMDILPTTAAIFGAKLPSDRHYDGYDISNVLFQQSTDAHQILFHPRSDGKSGNITAVRFHNYKGVFESGGPDPLLDCRLKSAPLMQHNPPLLFDLASDPTEKNLVNISSDFQRYLAGVMVQLRSEIIEDISEDMRSKVDERREKMVEPCCNHSNPICRC